MSAEAPAPAVVDDDESGDDNAPPKRQLGKAAKKRRAARHRMMRYIRKVVVAQRHSDVNLVPKVVCKRVFTSSNGGGKYCSRLSGGAKQVMRQIIDAELQNLFGTVASMQSVYGKRRVAPNAILLAANLIGLASIDANDDTSSRPTRVALFKLGLMRQGTQPELTVGRRLDNAAQKQTAAAAVKA